MVNLNLKAARCCTLFFSYRTPISKVHSEIQLEKNMVHEVALFKFSYC